MHYLALATDGDGTVLKSNKMLDETAAALERLRAAGMRLILVTGENPDELQEFPHLNLFHHVIGENGAIFFDLATGNVELLGEPPPDALVAAMREAGLRCDPGCAIICTDTDAKSKVDEILSQLNLAWHTVPNRDDLMVLPPDVDKARGLATLLKRLDIPPDRVVAVGDADNDRPMLELCGLGVAVGNAVPSLKVCADLVTAGHAGHGVIELADRLLREHN